jgi:hypothetical protein
MNNRIIEVKQTNGETFIIGPLLSVEEAKAGQRKIIEKLKPGSGTVTIGRLTTVEAYLETI